jgi:hypothetical protein
MSLRVLFNVYEMALLGHENKLLLIYVVRVLLKLSLRSNY